VVGGAKVWGIAVAPEERKMANEKRPMDEATKAKYTKAAARLAKTLAELSQLETQVNGFDKKLEAIETALQ
jgi:hypothetical protein